MESAESQTSSRRSSTPVAPTISPPTDSPPTAPSEGSEDMGKSTTESLDLTKLAKSTDFLSSNDDWDLHSNPTSIEDLNDREMDFPELAMSIRSRRQSNSMTSAKAPSRRPSLPPLSQLSESQATFSTPEARAAEMGGLESPLDQTPPLPHSPKYRTNIKVNLTPRGTEYFNKPQTPEPDEPLTSTPEVPRRAYGRPSALSVISDTTSVIEAKLMTPPRRPAQAPTPGSTLSAPRASSTKGRSGRRQLSRFQFEQAMVAMKMCDRYDEEQFKEAAAPFWDSGSRGVKEAMSELTIASQETSLGKDYDLCEKFSAIIGNFSDPEVLDILLPHLGDEANEVREAVRNCISSHHQEAIAPKLGAMLLSGENDKARMQAANLVFDISCDPTAKSYAILLQDEHRSKIREALEISLKEEMRLGGAEDEVDVLPSEVINAVSMLVRAVGNLHDSDAGPLLMKLLDQWRLRQEALEALANLQYKEAVPKLLEVLQLPDCFTEWDEPLQLGPTVDAMERLGVNLCWKVGVPPDED